MNYSAFATEDSPAIRYFTADEANAMLPLVGSITRDIKDLANELVDRKTRLDSIRSGSSYRTELYADELEQVDKTIESDKYRLQELLEELCDLGVHPHEPLKGVVSFPTLVKQSPSYFIWKLGDEEVYPIDQLEQDLTKDEPLESLFDQSEN